MECSYCSKIFTTKSNLTKHQKNTSYCLKLQGKYIEKEKKTTRKIKKAKCKYCTEWFAEGSRIITHERKCSYAVPILLNQVSGKQKEVDSKQKEVDSKQKEIDSIRIQLKIYKELADRFQTCIEKIALQPKTTSTNTTTNNIALYRRDQLDINSELLEW